MLRPRVVILNGPAGVGKTTVGRLLAGLVDSGACVHGDALRHFIVRRESEVATGLGYRNGGSVVTNFVDGRYELVVFDYIFENPAGLGVFMDAYTASAPVHLFTLWASLPTVIEREARRHGERAPLERRVEECYRALERCLDALGERIETDGMSAARVADEILARIVGNPQASLLSATTQ